MMIIFLLVSVLFISFSAAATASRDYFLSLIGVKTTMTETITINNKSSLYSYLGRHLHIGFPNSKSSVKYSIQVGSIQPSVDVNGKNCFLFSFDLQTGLTIGSLSDRSGSFKIIDIRDSIAFFVSCSNFDDEKKSNLFVSVTKALEEYRQSMTQDNTLNCLRLYQSFQQFVDTVPFAIGTFQLAPTSSSSGPNDLPSSGAYNIPPPNLYFSILPKDVCLYEIFGVSAQASIEEIKTAYKKLSLIFHPDRRSHLAEQFRDESLLTGLFQVISNGFTVLSNPEKRLLYHQTGLDDDSKISVANFKEFYRQINSPPSAGPVKENPSTSPNLMNNSPPLAGSSDPVKEDPSKNRSDPSPKLYDFHTRMVIDFVGPDAGNFIIESGYSQVKENSAHFKISCTEERRFHSASISLTAFGTKAVFKQSGRAGIVIFHKTSRMKYLRLLSSSSPSIETEVKDIGRDWIFVLAVPEHDRTVFNFSMFVKGLKKKKYNRATLQNYLLEDKSGVLFIVGHFGGYTGTNDDGDKNTAPREVGKDKDPPKKKAKLGKSKDESIEKGGNADSGLSTEQTDQFGSEVTSEEKTCNSTNSAGELAPNLAFQALYTHGLEPDEELALQEPLHQYLRAKKMSKMSFYIPLSPGNHIEVQHNQNAWALVLDPPSDGEPASLVYPSSLGYEDSHALFSLASILPHGITAQMKRDGILILAAQKLPGHGLKIEAEVLGKLVKALPADADYKSFGKALLDSFKKENLLYGELDIVLIIGQFVESPRPPQYIYRSTVNLFLKNI